MSFPYGQSRSAWLAWTLKRWRIALRMPQLGRKPRKITARRASASSGTEPQKAIGDDGD
jgi:hypothetical protein